MGQRSPLGSAGEKRGFGLGTEGIAALQAEPRMAWMKPAFASV